MSAGAGAADGVIYRDPVAQPGTVDAAAVRSHLGRIVGPTHVLTGDLASGYEVDWTGRFGGPSLCVIRPGSADEVSGVLSFLYGSGIGVVVQGGNTGLVGGGVPGPTQPPAVILSTRRLDRIGEVDDLSGQVTAEAGVTLGTLQRHASAAGWHYGVDLAARESATIGGTVATNAGGTHVIAHGMTRAQVTGVAAILPDGTALSHLGGLVKDNTGYDIAGLLCGSEGTLAVITSVRLRLHRPSPPVTVGLVGVPDYRAALALMAQARARAATGSALLAAEVIDETGLRLVMDLTGLPWPLRHHHRLVVLLEVADGGDASGLPFTDDDDAVVGCDAVARARLWEYRERQSEAFSALGVIHKLDVSLPLPVLADGAEGLCELVAQYPGVTEFGVFGHLGDGNLHVEIAGPSPDDRAIDRAVFAYVADRGGSISAEHGVGRAKAADLHLCRPAAQVAAMAAVKHAWDPQWQMNPGVIFAQPPGEQARPQVSD